LSPYAKFAWGVLAYSLVVILWGAFVRATGSGAGCGGHWPLCNGEVVPRTAGLATVIEFGHRLTSGLAVILVGVLVVGAWRSFPRGHVVRSSAFMCAVFMVVEALLGAGLVLLGLVAGNVSVARGFWAAGHLLNTFLLVGSLALTAWWASGGRPPRSRFRKETMVALSAVLAGVLFLAMSGAVTALGDTLFPPGTAAPGASGAAHVFVRLRVWHPVLALLVGILVAYAARGTLARVRPGTTKKLILAAAHLYAVQLLIGAINVWMQAPIGLQLAHLLVADLVWILLVLGTAGLLGEPARERARAVG